VYDRIDDGLEKRGFELLRVGLALDEKGGRIGSGEGYYDRFIPRLAITTRKVALALEQQIVPQIPIESHDKHVDIIITEDRVIYKI